AARWRGRPGLDPALGDNERASLENEKLIALRTLRELELDRMAGHVDDEDYQDLRSRYEGDAVRVLRRLDALGPVPSTPAPRPAPDRGYTPWTRQPAVLGARGAGLLVFGVVLGLLVSRYSTPAPPEPSMALPGPGSAPLPMAPGASSGAPRPLSKEMLAG